MALMVCTLEISRNMIAALTFSLDSSDEHAVAEEEDNGNFEWEDEDEN